MQILNHRREDLAQLGRDASSWARSCGLGFFLWLTDLLSGGPALNVRAVRGEGDIV